MSTTWFIATVLTALLALGCDQDQPSGAAKQALEQQPPLLKAALLGQADVVRDLLAKGADPNTSDGGMTALIHAAYQRNVSIAEILLDAGAKPNQATSEGVSPLMIAAAGGPEELVRLLLKHGADVHQTAKAGGTALDAAAVGGSAEIARALLDAGADPNACANKYNSTPLMQASAGGHVRVLKELLARGADLQARDHRGETAVFYAVGQNKPVALQVLIDAGADVNATNDAGVTALFSYAASPDRVDALRVLVNAGADPYRKYEREGWTALDRARIAGNAKVVELLTDAMARGRSTTSTKPDGD